MQPLNFLSRANANVESQQRCNVGEIARLEALLRKAEVRATAAETALEQKTAEGKELSNICDDLIARVQKEGRK